MGVLRQQRVYWVWEEGEGGEQVATMHQSPHWWCFDAPPPVATVPGRGSGEGRPLGRGLMSMLRQALLR